MARNKLSKRQRIKFRIKNKLRGTAVRPRLAVYRSNKAIYGQIINDDDGTTLASASSLDSTVTKEGPKVDISKQVGKLLADKAKAKDIDEVVFDRGGYLYHGRVKALADGAREGGLKF